MRIDHRTAARPPSRRRVLPRVNARRHQSITVPSCSTCWTDSTCAGLNSMTELVLGPLLRHGDETSACVWVETEGPALVTVTAGERQAESRTFGVHDHHYALICIEGLTPGTKTPYTVSVDGTQVWPEPD